MSKNLAKLLAQSKTQEAGTSYQPTTDPNIKMFKTPVNERVVVYVPLVKQKGQSEEEAKEVFSAVLHDYNEGQRFGRARCIHGISTGGPLELEDGTVIEYNGECPYCEAVSKEWDVANKGIDAELALNGVTREDCNPDQLKAIKRKYYGDRKIQNAEKYVVFPVAVLPVDPSNKYAVIPDREPELSYVIWRESRFKDKLESALQSLLDGGDSIKGLYWLWDFTYDTKGKEPTAMDSARNAKYKVIEQEKIIDMLKPFGEQAEKMALENKYIDEYAVEVIKDLKFETFDTIERKAGAMIDRANREEESFNDLTRVPLADSKEEEAFKKLGEAKATGEEPLVTEELGDTEGFFS